MRIISQNREVDLPYEEAVVYFSDDSKEDDVFICAGFHGKVFNVANYTSKTKANKVMEMLRIAYAGKFITTANIPEDFDSQLKEVMKHGFGAVTFREFDDCKVEFNNLNGYFIFPQDDEIEVGI